MYPRLHSWEGAEPEVKDRSLFCKRACVSTPTLPGRQDTGAPERKRLLVLTHYVPGPAVGTHVNLMTPSSPRLTEEETGA